MNVLKRLIFFVGRAALSLIFILAGIQKMLNWRQSEQMMVNSLCDWLGYLQGTSQNLIETLLSWAPFLLIGWIVFELLGGLLVLFGMKVRFGALLLILALIPSTFLLHNFWMMQEDQFNLQMNLFIGNIGICGGLLILLAAGNCCKKEKSPSPEK